MLALVAIFAAAAIQIPAKRERPHPSELTGESATKPKPVEPVPDKPHPVSSEFVPLGPWKVKCSGSLTLDLTANFGFDEHHRPSYRGELRRNDADSEAIAGHFSYRADRTLVLFNIGGNLLLIVAIRRQQPNRAVGFNDRNHYSCEFSPVTLAALLI